MEEEGNQHLHQPLLHTTTPSAFHGHLPNNIKLVLSNKSISSRLIFILFIGVVSAWANYEASRLFDIAIANEARETPPGKRFHLFYVSNDEISRLVITTSQFAQRILYSDGDDVIIKEKKKVNRVTVRLSSRNMTSPVTVESPPENDGEFILTISPSVMEGDNFRKSTFSAVLQGVMRVWVWDGHGKAPSGVVNGMVKYISSLNDAVLRSSASHDDDDEEEDVLCLKNTEDAMAMAKLLSYCEERKSGFVRELNQAMREGWEDGILDHALAVVPRQRPCGLVK